MDPVDPRRRQLVARRVRPYTTMSAEERLGRSLATLPAEAQHALAVVAARDDLPLVAGVWTGGGGGCLVANVVASAAGAADASDVTLDLRVLELIPELSSRDLNRLIVAWDEAAMADGGETDADLRRLLRGALAVAGVPAAGPAALQR
jgi:hypothetical protein